MRLDQQALPGPLLERLATSQPAFCPGHATRCQCQQHVAAHRQPQQECALKQHRQPLVQQHQQRALQRASAERLQLLAALVQRIEYDARRQGRHQRHDQHALRHHHGHWREQDA